jgi:hypothetical protein
MLLVVMLCLAHKIPDRLVSLNVSDGPDFDDMPSRTINFLPCSKRWIAARRQQHPDVDHRATVF